jgi:hypothetical protein
MILGCCSCSLGWDDGRPSMLTAPDASARWFTPQRTRTAAEAKTKRRLEVGEA